MPSCCYHSGILSGLRKTAVSFAVFEIMKERQMARFAFSEYPDLTCLFRATCAFPKNPMLSGDNTTAHSRGSYFARFSHLSDAAIMEFLPVASLPNGCLGHLIYWPTGMPSGRFTSILSSRLGRELDQHRAWFRALRAICARVAEEQHFVLNVSGTTAARFLPRATELFATPRIDIHPFQGKDNSVAGWWKTAPADSLQEHRHSGLLCRAFVSPPVVVNALPVDVSPIRTSPPDVAIADLLAGCLSDDFYALHVRSGGHIEKLLNWRLDNAAPEEQRVQLAIGANLNSPKTQKQLLESGAIGWVLFPATTQTSDNDRATTEATSENLEYSDPFLTHCTRRRAGPWPDQSEKSYLDDLILERSGVDHSPLSALKRIIAQRQLTGSGLSIRGGTAVVSFTSVPLSELQSLRVFRSHRGRWDFEPYGISIRRSALEKTSNSDCRQQRLRPVTYTSSESWAQLDDSERPFFQKSETVTKSGNVIDWTAEQEWRVIGNVDLAQIGSNDAVVFVPTKEDAAELQHLSPWRVMVLRDQQD